jgi:cardiolipin synthase
VQAAFLVRDNLRQRRTIERSVIQAIRGAHQQVDLVTPYFYPGKSFRRVLVSAAKRGVRVRLLLQGKLDYRLAGLAARVLYDELLGVGIEIHEYTAAFLHAKMIIVDRQWATLGSSNIDPLSLLLNLEANVVLRDPGLAGQLAAEFELAIADSRQITTPPLAQGAWAVLQRGFVAWVAHWYLRMAGLNGRY